ncbi:ABC transporter ATP-binding protein [Olsenella profusa]|uniref:ABC transporter ATP-binding protein n=1 Tax=Olsenella profusa TaxID=138595 RepID=A0ABS2F4D5_9ACTN|nr:ABC transporter ATP-binding protein [Olsenella profusa]MBM6775422.1 ABC transporter ATP-binding protein [Olsenella profusa]
MSARAEGDVATRAATGAPGARGAAAEAAELGAAARGAAARGAAAFELRDVEKSFGALRVLAGASARFEAGRVHVLTGPSGAGKTTLLRLLAGLERPDVGEVRRAKGLRLAMTFQEDRLLESLTATANVRLPHARLRGRELEAFLARETEALRAVGLPVDRRPVRELSGGQRRRVAILRCVLADADALLFDEPLKGMDEGTVARVMGYVRPLLAGRTVLWVTHDSRELDLLGKPVVWRVDGGRVSPGATSSGGGPSSPR